MQSQPLADRLRPEVLEDIFGQDHLLHENGLIASSIAGKRPLSLILWGPPGSGKTSLARLYGKAFSLNFYTMSGVLSGIGDLKKIVQEHLDHPLFSKGILLFVDEIHRFTKAQQDAFLPYIENGTIVLVGATAENPSFYLNSALLSRARVLKLKPLSEEALIAILDRSEKILGRLQLTDGARKVLIEFAQGDGRYLLNLVESLVGANIRAPFDEATLATFLSKRAPLGDKEGDQHYNLISALHKSIRGSDPDAALYWYSRMLLAGQDPKFIARRIIRAASEDVGLADPQALAICLHASETYQMLGSPEGELAIAEAILYLALAPKSNAVYKAFGRAKELAERTSHLDPPKAILNAPTKTMKSLGYGEGYRYDHDEKEGFSGQNYFPEGVERESFYQPVERGFEREMKKRLDYFTTLRKKLS
jgi:putative ATPase